MCYFVTLFWLGIVSKLPLLSPCTTLMLASALTLYNVNA